MRIFCYYFFFQITTIIMVLTFPNFKLKLLITFEILDVDNLCFHIWNQYTLLDNTRENEDTWRGTKSPQTHPPTHIRNHF